MANYKEDMIEYENHEPSVASKSLEHLNPLRSTFIHGPSSIKQTNYGAHPLEQMEKTRRSREEYRDLTVLRSVQGVHAPLRLLVERKAASKIGRLPFLPSSNLMLDVLSGRDDTILPEDIFNHPLEFCETQLPPHMTMERSLNIL